MEITFQKYQGTGNDFIMVDCVRQNGLDVSAALVQQLCNRRFGIGADGLICILDHDEYDFEMRYYNSDGSRSFCGNGARCAVAFAHKIGLFDNKAAFLAIDGVHEASWDGESAHLKMGDVNSIKFDGDAYVIDTGSPHYISFVPDLDDIEIIDFGKKIRYSEPYKTKGINVNAVKVINNNTLEMLTYERGVEDETFSCGTGATAVALAHAHKSHNYQPFESNIKVKGGKLKVSGIPKNEGFENIYLIGPATYVFHGSVSV